MRHHPIPRPPADLTLQPTLSHAEYFTLKPDDSWQKYSARNHELSLQYQASPQKLAELRTRFINIETIFSDTSGHSIWYTLGSPCVNNYVGIQTTRTDAYNSLIARLNTSSAPIQVATQAEEPLHPLKKLLPPINIGYLFASQDTERPNILLNILTCLTQEIPELDLRALLDTLVGYNTERLQRIMKTLEHTADAQSFSTDSECLTFFSNCHPHITHITTDPLNSIPAIRTFSIAPMAPLDPTAIPQFIIPPNLPQLGVDLHSTPPSDFSFTQRGNTPLIPITQPSSSFAERTAQQDIARLLNQYTEHLHKKNTTTGQPLIPLIDACRRNLDHGIAKFQPEYERLKTQIEATEKIKDSRIMQFGRNIGFFQPTHKRALLNTIDDILTNLKELEAGPRAILRTHT